MYIIYIFMIQTEQSKVRELSSEYASYKSLGFAEVPQS